MKKTLLVVLALLLVAPAAIAGTKAGIKLGLAMYNQTLSGGGESESGDMKMGLMGGGFVGIALGTGSIAIQPELLYVQKGMQETILDTTVKMKFDYIQIPVLLKTYIAPATAKTRFCAYAGPAIGILMSAKASAEGESEDIKEGFKSTDIGLVGGFGVDIDKIVLEFRADLGLTSIADTGGVDVDFSWKNVGFGIMAGYSFM